MQKTLFNCYSDNCCGYCNFHKCAMTVKQVKAKECLKKQCWHLERNEDHNWWKQREAKKQQRKARKERVDAAINSVAV